MMSIARACGGTSIRHYQKRVTFVIPGHILQDRATRRWRPVYTFVLLSSSGFCRRPNLSTDRPAVQSSLSARSPSGS